jgi:hypothetical protein
MNDKSSKFVLRRVGALGVVASACAMLLLVPNLRADDADNSSQPGRAVRLSSVDGEVHISRGSEAIADQALANTPLFEGTRIETGNDGRAEVQFEDGSVARISPDSALTLTVLKGAEGAEREAELQLNSGLGYFEIQGDESSHIRIRFADSEVTASGFTVLRINLDKASGELAVFSGNARLEGSAIPSLDLHGGQSVAFNASDPGNYNVADSIEPDSWDTWNSDRDQALTTASSERTAATDSLPDNKNPAWGDLDSSGNWYNVPDQGYVWSPYEAESPNWDPYGTGYWVSNPGSGYLWISGEPWGYMPYQCGAWNYYNSFGWGWAPGGCHPWWGGGRGWAINIGFAPPRYRFPIRPSRPLNPRPMPGHPVGPQPVITVHRRVPTDNVQLPTRTRNTGVNIAGRVVQPLRPLQQTRQPYNRSILGGPNSLSPGAPVCTVSRPAPRYGTPENNSIYRPGNNSAPRPTLNMPRPTAPSYTPPVYSRPASPSMPRSAPPMSSPPPRAPSAPPPSRPSGGGGGGGHPVSSPHR